MTEATQTEDKTRLASLATRKFEFEDIVNADPKCPPAALKVTKSYLSFVTNFEEPVYRSIIDLIVDTGLSNRRIIDIRAKMVELKYYIPAGKTADGVSKYRLSLAANENRVLDHQTTSRETLRRIEAERKERQRLKRKTVVSENTSRTQKQPVSEETSITKPTVSEDSSRTEGLVPCKKFTDVSEHSSRNYLDNSLEGLSYEGEGYTLPREEEALDQIAALVARHGDPGPAVVGYWRRLEAEGRFTADLVITHWETINGLQRAAMFGGR